ncbi:hemolysin family protein [Filomicrobium sp.]|uniref:hemolysin family protein n=1 Tax=Filomicrobium sp. TaxID=2024831 RepID=UPI00258907B8|nr:hemolysin family protein [Filomicrobium sp.]MCV0368531.1 hemolysin family protein [Filomicrobium sp.]
MTEIIVVVGLILINGLFALSELAVVSARRARLASLAEQGRSGAKSALALASEPGRFLSTVQIGITLIGILNGVFSGATLGSSLARDLLEMGFSHRLAELIGFGAVVVIVTYLSIVIGELVPKNLALRNPEGIACIVAPSMIALSRFAAPVVWVLDASTQVVFRLFGAHTDTARQVTEDEIKLLIAEAESAGVLETGERQMISGVLRLADRNVVGIMTPRTDVDWIDITDDVEEVKADVLATKHSRLPVGEGSIDATIGVVQTRELLAAMLEQEPLNLKALLRRAPVIPETTSALDALATLRDGEVPMVLIHDEYGNFEGLATPADILEAIAGVFRSEEEGEPAAVAREDGSWLLSGAMPADEMAEILDIRLPEKRDYQTVAGFVLASMRHLPTVGESADILGWRFEIVDMDGRRIDKVLVDRPRLGRRAVT